MLPRLLIVAFAAAALPAAPPFVDGVHLVNDRASPVTLKLTVPVSTRICPVAHPVPHIEGGLDPATYRWPAGMHRRGPAPAGRPGATFQVTAVVDPHTRVLCLCARGCDFQVVGLGKVAAPDRSTVVIGAKRARVVRWRRARSGTPAR